MFVELLFVVCWFAVSCFLFVTVCYCLLLFVNGLLSVVCYCVVCCCIAGC